MSPPRWVGRRRQRCCHPARPSTAQAAARARSSRCASHRGTSTRGHSRTAESRLQKHSPKRQPVRLAHECTASSIQARPGQPRAAGRSERLVGVNDGANKDVVTVSSLVTDVPDLQKGIYYQRAASGYTRRIHLATTHMGSQSCVSALRGGVGDGRRALALSLLGTVE